MTVKDDLGYIEPKPLQPVPVSYSQQAKTQDQKNWLDKVETVLTKAGTFLYSGAMGALDIYGRYKEIERGSIKTQPIEKADSIVILGQEMNKTNFYILIGLIVLVIMLIMWKK
ncbi:MAG: hypothetical protein QXO40_04080 [Candidatus Aenigmatarchaeota archaeon]